MGGGRDISRKSHCGTGGYQAEPGYLKSFGWLANIWTNRQVSMLSCTTRVTDRPRSLFFDIRVECPKAGHLG
jgi:hypothetical protein